MKRHGNLWQKLVSMKNIELAYERAKKHKTWQRQVQTVEKDKENKLKEIQEILINKEYKVSKYREKKIYEPKERTIYILPFFPDRIVHHALMNILSPIWDNIFIYDTYSCRKNKGQHKASMKCEQAVVRNEYALQCDISKFYPSINHDILMEVVKQKIKDKNVLWLIETIVRSFPNNKNVPIGNYTSQWFGNLYLHSLDMKIKQDFRIRDYIRYCDDFLLFGNNKEELWEIGKKIKEWCKTKRKLRLSKLRLFRTKEGVDFLGYRHMKNHYILIRKKTAKRIKRRIKELRWQIKYKTVNKDSARSTIDSISGWIKHACTYNFSKKLGLSEIRRYIIKMKGLPKHLNTKEDYLYVKDNFPEEYWKPKFQDLLETKDGWFFVENLSSKEEGIEDDTYKIVEDEGNFAQYELMENPEAKIFKLGFTVNEIKEILGWNGE